MRADRGLEISPTTMYMRRCLALGLSLMTGSAWVAGSGSPQADPELRSASQSGPPALPAGALRLVEYARHGVRIALCAEEPGPPVEHGGRRIPRTRVWVHDGTAMRQVATAAGTCDPAWSSDGAWVAVAAPDGVWVMSPDLRVSMHLVAPRHLDPAGHQAVHQALFDPVWAPDGTRLAFGVRDAAATWVEVVDTRTGQVVHTSGPDVGEFVWGEDSRSLRFGERVVRVP